MTTETARAPEAPRRGRVLLRQIIGFGIVGALVAGLYIGTMALAVDVLGTSATVGAFLAFTVGTLASYFGNARLSFRARMTRSNFRRFAVVVLVGLVANVAMARVLETLGWHHLAISLAILLTIPALNFAGHRLWTFR